MELYLTEYDHIVSETGFNLKVTPCEVTSTTDDETMLAAINNFHAFVILSTGSITVNTAYRTIVPACDYVHEYTISSTPAVDEDLF